MITDDGNIFEHLHIYIYIHIDWILQDMPYISKHVNHKLHLIK